MNNIINKSAKKTSVNDCNKFLLTLEFIKKVYFRNVNKFLNVEEISKDYNKSYVETFNIFIILVYEFYRFENMDLNSATYQAFKIMDTVFKQNWNYIFYSLDNFEYLHFLKKYIYSNIIGKNVFFIEFNFKALKTRYDEYLAEQ